MSIHKVSVNRMSVNNMSIYKILSAFLAYPEAGLVDNISDIRQQYFAKNLEKYFENKKTVSYSEPHFEYAELDGLFEFLSFSDLIELQEYYVQNFDRTPTHSLYLFEHLHGEDRARGQAMVDLLDEYKKEGVDLVANELPDYLPLFLEFLSVCDSQKATDLLSEAIHVIAYIGNNLKSSGSVYAGVFEVLQKLSPVVAQPLKVAPIRDMDEALETFGPGIDGVEPLVNSAGCGFKTASNCSAASSCSSSHGH